MSRWLVLTCVLTMLTATSSGQNDWRYLGGFPETPPTVHVDSCGGVVLQYSYELYYQAPGSDTVRQVLRGHQLEKPRVSFTTAGNFLLTGFAADSPTDSVRFTISKSCQGRDDTLLAEPVRTLTGCPSLHPGTTTTSITLRLRDTVYEGSYTQGYLYITPLTYTTCLTQFTTISLDGYPLDTPLGLAPVYDQNTHEIKFNIIRRQASALPSTRQPIVTPSNFGRLVYERGLGLYSQDTFVGVFETKPLSDTLLVARFDPVNQRWLIQSLPLAGSGSYKIVHRGINGLEIVHDGGSYRTDDVYDTALEVARVFPAEHQFVKFSAADRYAVLRDDASNKFVLFDGTALRNVAQAPRGSKIEQLVVTPSGEVLAKAESHWRLFGTNELYGTPLDSARSYTVRADTTEQLRFVQTWQAGKTHLLSIVGTDTTLLLSRPHYQVWRLQGHGPSSRLVSLDSTILHVQAQSAQPIQLTAQPAHDVYISGADTVLLVGTADYIFLQKGRAPWTLFGKRHKNYSISTLLGAFSFITHNTQTLDPTLTLTAAHIFHVIDQQHTSSSGAYFGQLPSQAIEAGDLLLVGPSERLPNQPPQRFFPMQLPKVFTNATTTAPYGMLNTQTVALQVPSHIYSNSSQVCDASERGYRWKYVVRSYAPGIVAAHAAGGRLAVAGNEGIYLRGDICLPNAPTVESTCINAGDSIYWKGQYYSTAGTYSAITPRAGTCDLRHTLHLEVRPPDSTHVFLCLNSSTSSPATTRQFYNLRIQREGEYQTPINVGGRCTQLAQVTALDLRQRLTTACLTPGGEVSWHNLRFDAVGTFTHRVDTGVCAGVYTLRIDSLFRQPDTLVDGSCVGRSNPYDPPNRFEQAGVFFIADTLSAQYSNGAICPVVTIRRVVVGQPDTVYLTRQATLGEVIRGDTVRFAGQIITYKEGSTSQQPCGRQVVLTIQLLVSAEEVLLRQWQVSPNPTSGLVRLTTPAEVPETLELRLELRNSVGQLLLSHDNIPSAIDLGAYPPGLYMLSITGQSGGRVWRIVRN